MIPITDLQLDILRVLWGRGEATVADVHGALPARRQLAASTVATLLTRLEKRGLIDHRTAGRRHVYRAKVSEQEVRTEILDTITDEVFGGDVAALVSHLIDARGVAAGDLERVRDLLDAMDADEGEPRDDA